MPWFKVRVKSVYVTLQNSLILKKKKKIQKSEPEPTLLFNVHILICLDIQALCTVLKD